MDNQQGKKPRIRFPEFNDAWAHKALNEFLYESKTRNGDLKYGKDEVLSVSGELGIVNQIEHLGRSYAGVSVHQYHVVELGDIVYTKSPLKANPFGIIKLNKGKAGIVSTLYAVYKVNQKTVYGPFIDNYFSLDANTNRYLRPLVKKGAKNDMKINNAYVLHDKIFAPTIPEQIRISYFLSAVDEKILQLTRKKELLEQYKKGVMQQLFSGKLKFKDENGKEFPKWEEKRLGDVCKSISSGKSKSSDDGSFLLYGSTGVIGKCQDFSHDGTFILIARVGANAGTINLVEGKFGVSDNTLVVICNAELYTAYLYFYLGFYNLNKLIFGSGQPLITGGQLKDLNLNLPSLTEQKKIADYLSNIDNKMERVNIQITQTQTIKKGLLQQMFV